MVKFLQDHQFDIYDEGVRYAFSDGPEEWRLEQAKTFWDVGSVSSIVQDLNGSRLTFLNDIVDWVEVPACNFDLAANIDFIVVYEMDEWLGQGVTAIQDSIGRRPAVSQFQIIHVFVLVLGDIFDQQDESDALGELVLVDHF